MTTYKRPRPITGKSRPDPNNLAALDRSEEAEKRLRDVWVDYPAQRVILNQIRKYMRLSKRARGEARRALTGRRLSQFSQAGKSSTFERLVVELKQEAVAAGLLPNPFQVIHITIDKRITLKMLYQEILNRLSDDFVSENKTPQESNKLDGKSWTVRENIKLLEQRVEQWVDKLGVELIVIDEVQRLVRDTDDAKEVSEKLQAFLDRGVVPIVFVGDEKSPAFFKVNPQFAARLLEPLELRPLNEKVSDLKKFKNFCVEFDNQLQDLGITAMPSNLAKDEILDALMTVSGGHVGRVARLIQVALPAAIERGAASIEAFDLSNATRDYAMELGWVDHDPFLIPVRAPDAE